jgi:hypothetical protein
MMKFVATVALMFVASVEVDALMLKPARSVVNMENQGRPASPVAPDTNRLLVDIKPHDNIGNQQISPRDIMNPFESPVQRPRAMTAQERSVEQIKTLLKVYPQTHDGIKSEIKRSKMTWSQLITIGGEFQDGDFLIIKDIFDEITAEGVLEAAEKLEKLTTASFRGTASKAPKKNASKSLKRL